MYRELYCLIYHVQLQVVQQLPKTNAKFFYRPVDRIFQLVRKKGWKQDPNNYEFVKSSMNCFRIMLSCPSARASFALSLSHQ